VLVRCGTPAPALTGNLAGAQRITIPVTTMYSGSITQLGMIADLDRADVVTGIANPADVVNQQLRQRIDSGATIGYAPGRQLNSERVVAAHPDVLVTSGIDEAGYPKLRDAGIGVVADAEWLEATPLGRAVLPINAVTALVGAPIVVVVLLRSRPGVGMQR
jgi:iron complex transport system substrate-binding protein